MERLKEGWIKDIKSKLLEMRDGNTQYGEKQIEEYISDLVCGLEHQGNRTSLEEAWLQAYELFADFEDLSDKEIVNARYIVEARLKAIIVCLGKFLPEDMSLEEADDPFLLAEQF